MVTIMSIVVDDKIIRRRGNCPNAAVRTGRKTTTQPKTAWQQAIDEGTLPLETFIGELRRRVNNHYDKIGEQCVK
jgi:hypothetical protein